MTQAASEPVPGSSDPGSVVLELGPGTGAVVLLASAEFDGAEIELSRDGDPSGRRTHSRVRRRCLAAGAQYAAVYPEVPEGDYTIWRDADGPAVRLRVPGGTVTTVWWPGPPGVPS